VSSSKFEIKVDPKASRDIKKLQYANPTVTKRIVKLIDSLSFNPYSGKHLKGKKQGCYSLRSGDYRIIYEVHSPQKVVHIIRIGHRKDIYR
jgi:addiction module toxin, RelE/StbE family